MVRTVTLVLMLALAVPVFAKKGGNGKGHGQDAATHHVAGPTVVFRPGDVQIIREYYGANPVNLPPGLQKKLARGKPLPPGWQKKLGAFPPALNARLGPLCSYCERGVYGGYGVVLDKRTAIILDIVQLAGDILRR